MSTPTIDRPAPLRTRRPRPRAATTSRGMRPSRKVRGLALLGSLVGTLALGILAALSIVPWWVPVIGVTAVGASFLWLRAGVQAEIAARRASAGGRPARRRVTRPSTAPASDRVEQDRVSAEAHEVSTAPTGATEPELMATTSVTAAADDARPDGWQPVPVPPPTYTLKARAERPAPPVPEVADEVPATPAVTGGEPDAGRAAAYGT